MATSLVLFLEKQETIRGNCVVHSFSATEVLYSLFDGDVEVPGSQVAASGMELFRPACLALEFDLTFPLEVDDPFHLAILALNSGYKSLLLKMVINGFRAHVQFML
jgi:hypothetical protein